LIDFVGFMIKKNYPKIFFGSEHVMKNVIVASQLYYDVANVQFHHSRVENKLQTRAAVHPL